MIKRKAVSTRGKVQFSRYFQNLKEGDNVSVVRDLAIASSFPERLQGRTGTVIEKRGRYYIIKIMDQNKEKRFIIEPVHLKKVIK